MNSGGYIAGKNTSQQQSSEREVSGMDKVLKKGKAMVMMLEQGKTEGATALLDELTRMREQDLFSELGHLTRKLHDALKSVEISDEVSELVEEFPDARQRLGYVVRLTEESANKTLSIIEKLIPEAESSSIRAGQLLEEMQQIDPDPSAKTRDLAGLHSRLQQHLQLQLDSQVHNGLSEIMMAQDFQDITGQIIQRVSMLVGEIEEGLVDIIRKTPISGAGTDAKHSLDESEQLSGPAVPGLVDGDRLDSQDDVDQLLMEYGF